MIAKVMMLCVVLMYGSNGVRVGGEMMVMMIVL